MFEHLWRLLTDKRTRCVVCAATVGYVSRAGHTRWLCAGCSATGEVQAA